MDEIPCPETPTRIIEEETTLIPGPRFETLPRSKQMNETINEKPMLMDSHEEIDISTRTAVAPAALGPSIGESISHIHETAALAPSHRLSASTTRSRFSFLAFSAPPPDYINQSTVMPTDEERARNLKREPLPLRNALNMNENQKWCRVCKRIRTPRAHHCRHTGKCVRKFDHFCPWIGAGKPSI